VAEAHPSSKITVFICDDVEAVREMVRLTGEPDFEVVGEASNGIAAVLGIKDHQPDVVVLDLDMPEIDGLQVMNVTRVLSPRTRVVVFSAFPDHTSGGRALRRGAKRLLRKGVSLPELLDAAREVALPRAA
jgi:DNA-binding NarL/FixJ family response regulator